MNPSSDITHTNSLNLWAMGYRRYYSPMLHARISEPAADPLVMPRVRPSLVLRSVANPKGEGAGSHPVPGGRRRCSST
jgi:hypothetical protein